MSNTEDNTPIDNELKAYLAGEDGVSAAYQETGAEEPPAELDRLILAAAHNAVGSTVDSSVDSAVKPNAPRKLANLQQKFSIAASFMIGVLITSMYFNRPDGGAENATSSVVVQEPLITRADEQRAPVPAPAAPTPAATPALGPPVSRAAVEQESQPQPLERVGAQSVEQPAPQAARSATVETREAPEAAANKTASSEDAPTEDNAAGTANIAADTGVELQENILQLTTTSETVPPAISANFNETGAESDTADRPLEEITVTGSRIRAEADTSYRENQQQWLERILALGEIIVFQIDALEENNSRLEEEMELFSEAYPDVDIEAELENLGEE